MSLKVIVKWSGKEFNIENIDPLETVMELKVKIMEQTGVRPERQKLLNLKCKGKAATEDMKIGSLGLKDNFKLMMMGSLEETIIETLPLVSVADLKAFCAKVMADRGLTPSEVDNIIGLDDGAEMIKVRICYRLR